MEPWGSQHSPHGVHVGGGQPGAAHGGAVVGPHDPLCQQKVPEQAGYQQVLPEELLEKICQDIAGVTTGMFQHLRYCEKGLGHKTVLTFCSSDEESPAALQGRDDNQEREILPAELPQTPWLLHSTLTQLNTFYLGLFFTFFGSNLPFGVSFQLILTKFLENY